jgi:hypothetical protein
VVNPAQAGATRLAKRARVSAHPASCNSRRASVAKGPRVSSTSFCAVSLSQCNACHGFAVVGIERFPLERVGQASWWFDLEVFPSQVEELAIGRLHRDPLVGAANSRVEGHLGTGGPLRPHQQEAKIRANRLMSGPFAGETSQGHHEGWSRQRGSGEGLCLGL